MYDCKYLTTFFCISLSQVGKKPLAPEKKKYYYAYRKCSAAAAEPQGYQYSQLVTKSVDCSTQSHRMEQERGMKGVTVKNRKHKEKLVGGLLFH